MQEPAFAKLNLALPVRGREADGSHRIETIFAFAEAGDLLSAADSPTLTLALDGPFARQLTADNLVLRAAGALQRRYGVARGAALTLHKHLPVASGLGGGSADAAATLRLLNRFWGVSASPDDLLAIAATLGADVPACLLSRPARGEGRGDRLTQLEDWPLAGTPVLLVNPGQALATADVFNAWDGQDRGPLGDPLTGRNDLEPSARHLFPEISNIINELCATPDTLLVRMSGSGATCFALYLHADSRDAAHAHLARTHPDWWLLSTRLRP